MPLLPLPNQYKWLYHEDSPRVLVAAIDLYGEREIKGAIHNLKILSWAKAVGKKLGISVTNDELPWCGTFMAYCVKSAGYEPPAIAVRAKSWLNFGTVQNNAMLGDILVFDRVGGGHVGLYVGEDETHYHVLGGNQGDAVSIFRIAKYRCTGIRRCPWKIKQPPNVRKILLSPIGTVSNNES